MRRVLPALCLLALSCTGCDGLDTSRRAPPTPAAPARPDAITGRLLPDGRRYAARIRVITLTRRGAESEGRLSDRMRAVLELRPRGGGAAGGGRLRRIPLGEYQSGSHYEPRSTIWSLLAAVPLPGGGADGVAVSTILDDAGVSQVELSILSLQTGRSVPLVTATSPSNQDAHPRVTVRVVPRGLEADVTIPTAPRREHLDHLMFRRRADRFDVWAPEGWSIERRD